MKVGIAILSVMAAVWAVGALFVGRAALWAYPAVVIVAFAPLAMVAARPQPARTDEDARRIRRVVGLATLFEVFAIIAGVNVAVWARRADLVVCVVAAVVGLHFLPLARWMPNARYYLTGLALLVAACAGAIVPGGLRDVAVASAASAILWTTALSFTLRVRSRA